MMRRVVSKRRLGLCLSMDSRTVFSSGLCLCVCTNSRNIIGRNPSMVIPLLANQDLIPMLVRIRLKCILVMSH